MSKKRLLAILLSTLLLIGASPVMAAGSAKDPLISRSYISDTCEPGLVQSALSQLDKALGPIYDRVGSIARTGKISTGSFETVACAAGETINLKVGGSVIVLSGSATAETRYGGLLNITAAAIADSGDPLLQGNRYMAVENSSVTVTLRSGARVALDGDAYKGAPKAVFSDVPPPHWAFYNVEYMADVKLVNGTGGGKFSPDDNMTRGDFVTVLGRLYGVDTSRYSSSRFTDVDARLYYSPHVNWAYESGILEGYGGGLFGPRDYITREQMARIIVNYAKFAGIDLKSDGSGGLFADDGSISSWAKKDVYTARDSGLIQGQGGNIFSPQGNAKRCEVCAVIFRLVNQ